MYKHEMTDDQHLDLLKTLLKLKCNVLISTYDNAIYGGMLSEWKKVEFTSVTRRGRATEVLYMNFQEPVQLHDYNFLGQDYRERERIRKKIKRHVTGLRRLPELEKKAILRAILHEDT